MSRFTEDAQKLLDAATSAASRGHCSPETTILIDPEGGIRVCAADGWPLDRLAEERGARTAYRISANSGKVRVEGREGWRTCVLEAKTSQHVRRALTTSLTF